MSLLADAKAATAAALIKREAAKEAAEQAKAALETAKAILASLADHTEYTKQKAQELVEKRKAELAEANKKWSKAWWDHSEAQKAEKVAAFKDAQEAAAKAKADAAAAVAATVAKKKAAKALPDDPAASWADIDAKGTPDAYQPPKGHQPSTKVPPFERSISLWGKRKILSSADFAALGDELTGQAGRLAGIYHTSFTTAIYDSLGDAIREGKTLRDWLPHAQQLFDGFGAAGGERLYSGQTWSPWYADLVFRNAMQASYASGRYAEMFSPEWIEASPFWLYDATADGRTRPEHRALDGKVFRKDDVAARVFLPPWGHNCRCTAIELSEDDVKDGKYEVSKGTDILELFKPPKGWNADRVASLVPESQRKRKPRALPKAPEPPPEATPAPAAPVAPAVIVDGWPTDPRQLRLVQKLGGTTGAELVEDAAGVRYVRKMGANEGHLRDEFAADRMYEALGVRVPPGRLYETPDGPVKLTRFLTGTERLRDVVAAGGPRAAKVLELLQRDLSADALLGNWDVVGLDNVLVDAKGIPWRIDNGGALRYRGAGVMKKAFDDYPTELWTMRDPVLNGDAGPMFKGTDPSTIPGRIREMSARRRELLAATLPELRATIAARLDQLESVADLMDEATADKWLVGYADELAKHTVGIRKAGITARMPREINQDTTGGPTYTPHGANEVVDENGLPYDHLRSRKGGARSIVSDLASYTSTQGGDYSIVSRWAAEQARSSWSDDARGVKYMIAMYRSQPMTSYFWAPRAGVAGLKASEAAMKAFFAARGGETKVRTSMAIQHAFTRELLGRVKINKGAKKGLRLVRTEDMKEVVTRYGMKRGGRYVYTRGAMESYSAFNPVSIYGSEQFWFDDVPLLRILGTYWQEQSAGYVGFNGRGGGMFAGDGENEFVGMLDGLEGFYGTRPP